MKSTQRHTALAVIFLAVSFVGAPLLAQPRVPDQRGGPPTPETPYILVAAFHSPDRQLGVTMADELRKRLQSEHTAKELFVIPKNNINSTLEASGYRPDSALNASDLMELSKQLRGEQVVDGTVTKTGTGVHVEARLLMRTGQQTVGQPLPKVDAKDPGDAARQLERALTEAGKSLPAYKTCTNALRAQKYDDAIRAARAGIAGYANSTLSRLCLLSAYQLQKTAPPDSIIAVATAITALDPTSMIALANLADAYRAKGDSAKAIETNLAIYKLDPSNSAVAQGIVQELATAGQPEKALPIIDSLLVQNPGDPAMLRTKWLLLLRAKRFKEGIAAGDEYVKSDTAAANADFFNRQIGAAQQDSNVAAVQQIAARAFQKFPKEISYPLLLAQSYNKAGQLQQSLQAARRATELDPKNSNAWLFAIAAANGTNQRDSAAAFAKMAIAAGADKNALATSLLGPTNDLVRKAQETKARADWEEALRSAQSVDALASSPQSKFFIGVTSFQVAVDILGEVQTLAKSQKKADQAQACTKAKAAEDLLATTSMAMPGGGSVDKDTAGKIMAGTMQYGEFITQVKKAFCK